MTSSITMHKASLYLSLALTAILSLSSTHASAANLTVTVNPHVPMITIVDQANGAIESCTAFFTSAGTAMTASCVTLGTSTLSSTEPTAPEGLSVYASPVTVGTSNTQYEYANPNYTVSGEIENPGTTQTNNTYLAPIWIINNTTGSIVFCYTYSGLNTHGVQGNTGACLSLGVAP